MKTNVFVLFFAGILVSTGFSQQTFDTYKLWEVDETGDIYLYGPVDDKLEITRLDKNFNVLKTLSVDAPEGYWAKRFDVRFHDSIVEVVFVKMTKMFFIQYTCDLSCRKNDFEISGDDLKLIRKGLFAKEDADEYVRTTEYLNTAVYGGSAPFQEREYQGMVFKLFHNNSNLLVRSYKYKANAELRMFARSGVDRFYKYKKYATLDLEKQASFGEILHVDEKYVYGYIREEGTENCYFFKADHRTGELIEFNRQSVPDSAERQFMSIKYLEKLNEFCCYGFTSSKTKGSYDKIYIRRLDHNGLNKGMDYVYAINQETDKGELIINDVQDRLDVRCDNYNIYLTWIGSDVRGRAVQTECSAKYVLEVDIHASDGQVDEEFYFLGKGSDHNSFNKVNFKGKLIVGNVLAIHRGLRYYLARDVRKKKPAYYLFRIKDNHTLSFGAEKIGRYISDYYVSDDSERFLYRSSKDPLHSHYDTDLEKTNFTLVDLFK